VVVVVVLVVFAEAPFRHARLPFLLFAVFVAINFEEEEEEEEEQVEEDDDLIGILDPVKKSAILYSHLLIISLSLVSLLSRESAASLERTAIHAKERYFVVV
jgi:hypothetical protein